MASLWKIPSSFSIYFHLTEKEKNDFNWKKRQGDTRKAFLEEWSFFERHLEETESDRFLISILSENLKLNTEKLQSRNTLRNKLEKLVKLLTFSY